MGELDEQNLHLALSADVSRQKVVSTIFGCIDGYILSWAKDILCILYSMCAYIYNIYGIYIWLLVNYVLKNISNYRRAGKDDEKRMIRK